MLWDYTLQELFVKVGFTRWPLLICSVIGAAIIVERGIYFLRLHLNYPTFRTQLFDFLQHKKTSEAIQLAKSHPSPIAQLAALYLKELNNPAREDLLKREGSYALELVEQRIRGLASITHIAPLLGLLGTVSGLVSTFHQIELAAGQVQAEQLAGGIWEALISTVFGLIVAIPCMAAYHAFESQTDRITRRMQFIVSELDGFFGHKSENFKLQNTASNTMDEMNTAE